MLESVLIGKNISASFNGLQNNSNWWRSFCFEESAGLVNDSEDRVNEWIVQPSRAVVCSVTRLYDYTLH